jgi:hypothetical protein
MIPVAAVVAMSLGIAPARAGYIELSGSLSVSTGGKAPVYDDPTTGAAFIDYGPSTSVAMMTPNSDLGKAFGTDHIDVNGEGSDVTFGLIDVATDKTTPHTDVTINFAFNVTLTNYDATDSDKPLGTGTFQVTGILGGSLGGGKKVNLNQIKSYAMTPADGKVIIGNEKFTVSNLLYNPAGANFPGVFTAHITGGVFVHPVPEPGSLALFGLGGLGAWHAFRRRRGTAARA